MKTSIRSILIGAGNRGASPRNSSQKRAICKSSAAPLILGRFNDLDRVFYFFPLAACFEAVAVLFFCVFALVFACFCEAFLFVAFGDLSPIEMDITHVNGSSASQNYNFRQPQPHPRSPPLTQLPLRQQIDECMRPATRETWQIFPCSPEEPPSRTLFKPLDWRASLEADSQPITLKMPERGLEPLILAEPDPKSGVSANFTTPASL
jgi:hypothetical protein